MSSAISRNAQRSLRRDAECLGQIAMAVEQILASDLPADVRQGISESVRFHTVAFVRIVKIRGFEEAQLVGSGVLVSAGRAKAILTDSPIYSHRLVGDNMIPSYKINLRDGIS